MTLTISFSILMHYLTLPCIFLLLIQFCKAENPNNSKLPIVFVYIVVPAVCKHGLPDYIKTSVEQAIFTQPDCDVIMVSNYAECQEIEKTVNKVQHLIKIDSTKISSNRTAHFANASKSVFASDYGGELWMTSALRFFILEDIMNYKGYNELMHIEADNTIYGKFSSILGILRQGYPLAATPLTANKSFITASVFWISSLSSLIHFNDYMMALILNTDGAYKDYLVWLRRYACCKKNGVDPDENGNGIKPFAINEMSMLGNYHRLYPNIFKLLPVAPSYNEYIQKRPFCNVSTFSPGGSEVGPPTGHGVWDPNSWGQHIGGTSRKKGRDKGFIDTSHAAGQAIILGQCTVSMICGNQSISPYAFKSSNEDVVDITQSRSGEDNSNIRANKENKNYTSTTVSLYKRLRINENNSSSSLQLQHYASCYTAPFVRCGTQVHWTPLWNLHVHSKHTIDYRSKPCDCPDNSIF